MAASVFHPSKVKKLFFLKNDFDFLVTNKLVYLESQLFEETLRKLGYILMQGITSSIEFKYTNFDQKIEIASNDYLGVRITGTQT